MFVPDVGLPTLDDFSEKKDDYYTITSYNTIYNQYTILYVYMYMCIHTCIIYIYIYIHIHTYIYM